MSLQLARSWTVGVRPQAIEPLGRCAEFIETANSQCKVFLTEPLGDVTNSNIIAGANHRLRMVLPQERAYGIAGDAPIELRAEN